MSSNEEQSGAGRREVAYRLFASEFDDADFSYSESDEERAPNYVVTPTGARVNRLFLVGVLTEVETVSEDYLRARIVDPSGPFVVYAGQYQPEALAFLESAQPPTFVAVTGKARTYQPDDSDQVYTSVRPESISEVDAGTRDRWVVATAEQTLERVTHTAEAKQSGLTGDDLRAALVEHGVDEGLASGIPIALEHYGTTGEYLSGIRSLALDAARVVADERDEVESLSIRPGQGTDDAVPALVETPIDVDTASTQAETGEDGALSATADDAASDQRAGTAEPSTDPATASTSETASADGADEGPAATGEEPAEAAAESTETDESAPAASDSSTTEAADTTTETTTVAGNDQTTGQEPVTEQESASAVESVTESEPTTETTTESEPATETTTESEPATETTTESEPATETETVDESDELGDFDPEFDLDEDEREEIESEYGTEFQSGAEVDDPGEADIETPDPDELDASSESGASETSGAATAATDDAVTDTSDADAATDAGEEIDLEDAVMDAMGKLDDGDGADRAAIVDAVVDRTGSDPDAVEDAIQDALMGGRCYEPDDGVLKPI